MLTISEVSERTGLTPYTLRYYEKVGVLKEPGHRDGGARRYTENEVSFIECLNGLKKLGMSLEEITEFFRGGCVMEEIERGGDLSKLTPSLNKRTAILSKHLTELETKRRELDRIIALTQDKLAFYEGLAQDVGG